MNSKFKTSLCKLFEATGSCNFGQKCSFAHGAHELRKPDDPVPREALTERNDRVPYSNYKTIKCCYFYRDGFCPFGIKCSYAHGDYELRSKYDPIFPPIDSYPPVPPQLFFPYYCSEIPPMTQTANGQNQMISVNQNSVLNLESMGYQL